MGKFGIGARVRDRDGDLAEVIGKPEKGVREVRYSGGKFDGMVLDWRKSELEVAEAGWQAVGGVLTDGESTVDFREAAFRLVSADEPQFYVGQRVVSSERNGDVGNFVGTIFDISNASVDVAFDDGWTDGHDGDAFDGSSNHWYVDPSDLSPFTLEAGKFYRTRDGRKVGPMTVWADMTANADGAPLYHSPLSPLNGDYWQQNGINAEPGYVSGDTNLDIVAEWGEPDVVVEDATDVVWVPTAGMSVEWLGDTSEFYTNGRTYKIVGGGPDWFLLTDDNDSVGDHNWTVDSLVDQFKPVTPQPKFKVGDRVDLMRDGEPVEKWSNMTITSIDHSEFLYPIGTDVGLPCFESELRLSPPSPRLPIGTEIILTGRVTGHNPVDPNSTNVVIDGLPAGRNSHGVSSNAISAA